MDGTGLWLCRARDHGGIIAFRPRLPPEWRRLRFALGIRSSRLRVEAGHDVTTYTLSEGEILTIHHDGDPITLTAAAPEATRAALPPVSEPEPEFAPAPPASRTVRVSTP